MNRPSHHTYALVVGFLALIVLPMSTRATEKTKQVVWAEPREGMAIVYFIRPGHFQGGGRTMFVYADDRFLGTLDNKTYTYAYFEPGRYLLWMNWTRVNKDIELGPNTVTYMDTWNRFAILGDDEGKALITEVGVYAVPEAKEVKTAEKQVAGRSDRAQLMAQKQGRATLEAVEAPSIPADTEGLVHLPQYTEIQLELMESATTELASHGEEIWFRVAKDVGNEADRVVVPKGLLVKGTLRRSAEAKGFGQSGTLNIVVPFITSPDGTRIPTVGQLADEGHNRAGASIATGVAFGVFAGWAIQGREAFRLAGETCSVWTMHEAWVAPLAEGGVVRTPDQSPEGVQRLSVPKLVSVEFAPEHRTSPKDIIVFMESGKPLAHVEVTEVDGWELPDPIPARSLSPSEKGDGWNCSFDGWEVIRVLRPKGATTDIPVRLGGEFEDGSRFVGDVSVKFTLKAKE